MPPKQPITDPGALVEPGIGAARRLPAPWSLATPAVSMPLGVVDIIAAVLRSGSGEERLREAVRHLFPAVWARPVSAGKWALWLLLMALKQLSKRRKVLLPAYGSPTVVRAVMHADLEVVLADVSPADFNLDPAAFAEVANEELLCVVPEHLFGKCCPMPAILETARQHGIWVIEDVAQATGAVCEGRRAGTWGDAAFFSFARGKGSRGYRGGLLTVASDQRLVEAVEQVYEQVPRYALIGSVTHVPVAMAMAALSAPWLWYGLRNCRFLGVGKETQTMTPSLATLPGWQALLAARALNLCEQYNRQRAAWGWRIHEALCALPSFAPQQRQPEDGVFVRLAVRVASPQQREALIRDLRTRGIDASPWYSHPAYGYPWWPFGHPPGGAFPVAEELPRHLVVLPVHHAMDERRTEALVDVFRNHVVAPK